MRVIRVNRYRVGKRALSEAASILAEGGVVAFPTETAYGLAVDPRNPKAMAKVYAIKGRERGKPLPIVAADIVQAVRVAVFSDVLRPLTRRWPAPLTLVARARSAALRKLADDGTVAVRVPAAAWARALPAALGHPVTSTSANRAGARPSYSGTAVRRAFARQRRVPDLILDAGRLPTRKPSTIVRAVRGTIEVLRQGVQRIDS